MKLAGCVIYCLLLLAGCSNEQRKFTKLVWADEFDYTGLPDSTRWSYDTGGHGWGNNELQYYTEKDIRNAFVENGKLHIRAIKEEGDSIKKYTSARVISKNKGDWKYGRIEVKAKLPTGRGVWPAIWMLPTDWEYGGWPESGEIDIMENVGFNADTIFASVHTKTYNHAIGTNKTSGIKLTGTSENFHVYALEWTEEVIKVFVDDKMFYEFANEKVTSNEWPFDKRFHLLLNIAVGGNWGGKMGVDETIFPQQLEIDYVRVYQ